MSLSNEELETIRVSVSLMTSRASDGKNAHLGTGLGYTVRAGDLEKLAIELLAWRTQVPDFEYDKETGKIMYTGDIGD